MSKALFRTALLVSAMSVANASHANDAQTAFFASVAQLCGTTFEGGSVFSANPQDGISGKTLVAKVASCSADEIRIPFVVGEDRSRTWIITRTADGLQLKHDHRHADGTPDAVTMYGGMASGQGSAQSQSFGADLHTAKLIPAAATNVWTLSLSPDQRTMTYFLERDGKPRFKAELLRR